MDLPFIINRTFSKLPGSRPACAATFDKAKLEELLEEDASKVLREAARFLHVPEVKIAQVIDTSNTVNVTFVEKNEELYNEWEDDE